MLRRVGFLLKQAKIMDFTKNERVFKLISVIVGGRGDLWRASCGEENLSVKILMKSGTKSSDVQRQEISSLKQDGQIKRDMFHVNLSYVIEGWEESSIGRVLILSELQKALLTKYICQADSMTAIDKRVESCRDKLFQILQGVSFIHSHDAVLR